MPVYGAALMYSPLTRPCRVKRPASLILTLARAFGILLTVAFSILLTVAFNILLTLTLAVLLTLAPFHILLALPFTAVLFVSHALPPKYSSVPATHL